MRTFLSFSRWWRPFILIVQRWPPSDDINIQPMLTAWRCAHHLPIDQSAAIYWSPWWCIISNDALLTDWISVQAPALRCLLLTDYVRPGFTDYRKRPCPQQVHVTYIAFTIWNSYWNQPEWDVTCISHGQGFILLYHMCHCDPTHPCGIYKLYPTAVFLHWMQNS